MTVKLRRYVALLGVVVLTEGAALCPRETHTPSIEGAVQREATQALEERVGQIDALLYAADRRNCEYKPGSKPEGPIDVLLWNARNEQWQKEAGAIEVGYCADLEAYRAFVEQRAAGWRVRMVELDDKQAALCADK